MIRAAYEYRSVVPATCTGVLLAAIAASVCGGIFSITPLSGWDMEANGPYPTSGLTLFKAMVHNVQNGYWPSRVIYDLSSVATERFVGVTTAIVIGFLAGFSYVWSSTPYVDCRSYVDGPTLVRGPNAPEEADRHLNANADTEEDTINLAPNVRWPRAYRVLNLLVCGAIGSGKTRIILYWLNQLILRTKGRLVDHALLIHDTTGEIFEGLPLASEEFAALHPHRDGGWAWAMGRDLQTVEDIEEAADQAISNTAESMWGKGAAAILAGCMLTAQSENGEAWGMPQLYEIAMRPPEAMKEAFEKAYPVAAKLIEFADGELSKTSLGMLLTFRASILRTLRPLSIAWQKTPGNKQFSFRAWVRNDGLQPNVVVLQRSARYPQLSKLWIGMALDTIAGHVGDPDFPVSQTRTRTLVLDELPTLGKLKRLPELLDTGRNKGLTTIASVQDMEQLKTVYKEAATSIAGRFRLKIFGAQVAGPALKDLAEKEIGMRRVNHRQFKTTVTHGPNGLTQQTSPEDRIDTVPVVSPEHLAARLGVKNSQVRAVLVGLPNPLELAWPMTVWPKRQEG